jgi:hypothetical protein
MKKILIAALASFILFSAKAQQIQMHESFKQDKELKDAFLKFDLTPFMSDKANFVFDTIEREVSTNKELVSLIKDYIRIPKNAQIKKASETNNGYIQTFGIYKGDDALYYVRFTLSPLTSKLEEVSVEKNN